MKVLAALSGGVDSAVAAARMVDAGHEVTGIHLALSNNPQSFRTGARGCCSLEDSRDARRAADVLGIPFYVWDMAEQFRADVVEDFVAEYAAGRTPNPCLRCNERIKFAAVLDRAIALGFDAVATGHYARLASGANGIEMHRAVDAAKDQSYVLGVLEQWQLERSLFPLGDSVKGEVRAEADARGLTVAAKPDSHDICFIADGDTSGWLAERLGEQSGDIVDAITGERLGGHSGAYAFTVGQRRGLALGVPAADGAPRYVTSVDPSTRTVFVGPPTLLDIDVIEGIKPHWCQEIPAAGARVGVQVRAHGAEVPALVRSADAVSAELVTDTAIRGLAAGQAAVMYEGTRVVGAVTVSRARRNA